MSHPQLSVLGIDVASGRWRDVGSALATFSPHVRDPWLRITPAPLRWPEPSPLTPAALAESIDAFARENHVAAVSLDGPQGWRDPQGSVGQGVGRSCERSARTPGKSGAYGHTYPRNQAGWISFSIELFDRLLNLEDVHLVQEANVPLQALPGSAYYVLECFPTVTWRSTGLVPLPAKRRKPDIANFAGRLAERWGLPATAPLSHDDLQAVVASLPAAALFGVGTPVKHGVPARVIAEVDGAPQHRVEGIIWDACPPIP